MPWWQHHHCHLGVTVLPLVLLWHEHGGTFVVTMVSPPTQLLAALWCDHGGTTAAPAPWWHHQRDHGMMVALLLVSLWHDPGVTVGVTITTAGPPYHH